MGTPRTLVARFLLVAVAGAGVSACGSSSSGSAQGSMAIANPSGSCTATGDGSRAGYHSAAGTWLPDCQNPLRREYWRVFAQAPDSAYTLPRVDGAPELKAACDDSGHELSALVVTYSLCHPASNSEEVERVNDMQPADALTITHYMHGLLRFTATGSIGISPYPPPSDILDACELHSESVSTELRQICDRERERLKSGHAIGFDYTGPGAIELVALLNELYGIH